MAVCEPCSGQLVGFQWSPVLSCGALFRYHHTLIIGLDSWSHRCRPVLLLRNRPGCLCMAGLSIHMRVSAENLAGVAVQVWQLCRQVWAEQTPSRHPVHGTAASMVPTYLLRSFISLPVPVVFSAAFVRTSPEIYSLLAGVCHVFLGLEKLSAREAWPVWSISSHPGMPCSHLPQLSEPPADIGDVSRRPDWHETSPCQGGPVTASETAWSQDSVGHGWGHSV